MKRSVAIGVVCLAVLGLVLGSVPAAEARGHVVFGFNFPLWVGPWGWGAPYPYSPYAAPYYAAPPVIVQQPPAYVAPEPPQAPAYWYYCQSPQGYFPYVQQCPQGWMQVVPPAAPPAR